MNFRRRLRILTSRKSPSTEMMKRTYNRAFSNGGVVQDFTANVENLRTLSRTLGYDNVDRGKIDTRRNSLQYSEEFIQSVWTKDSTVTFTQNSDINPVTFQNTSTKMTFTSASQTDFRFYQSVTTIGTGSTVTLSIYVKSTSFQYFHIRLISGVQYAICHDNTTGVITRGYYDGTVLGAIPLASSSTLINGYYRVSITVPYSVTPFILFAPSTSATNSRPVGASSTGFAYVYGIQLEVGSVVTDYQRISNNTYKTLLDPYSFSYVPSSYGEGKNFTEVHNKRNILSWSEDFTNSIWVKNSLTVTSNIITAPDGYVTADKIVESTGTPSYRRIYQLSTGANTPLGFHTFSIYIKKAERFVIGLSMSDGVTGDVGCTFNLNTISCIPAYTNGSWTLLGSKISDAGGGWFKCSISGYRNSGVRSDVFVYMLDDTGNSTYTGNGTSGIYIWGAQLEQSNGVGMYLPKTNIVLDNNVDFNFTRATSATLVNKQGLIEDSCYNLLQYSENFGNSFWLKNAITVTANVAIAPNGTLTAFSYSDDLSNNNHLLQLTSPSSNTYPVGTTLTWSVYIKANGSQWVFIDLYNATDYGAYFDLVNGVIGSTIGSGVQPIITNAGNGWWRCSVTKTTTSSAPTDLSVNAVLSNGGNSTRPGTGTSKYYIWGAQLANGSLRPYLKTTNRLNVPRIDYTRNKPSFLIEPSRTNLMQRSSELENTYWLKNNTTVVANSIIGPDGVSSADSLLETITNGTHYFDNSSGIATTIGTTYTRSLYVKSNGRQWVVLDFFNTTDYVAYFDIINGVIGTVDPSISASIKSIGNGWWRCSVTRVATTSATFNGVIIAISNGSASYIGDVTKGLYIWGQQFEQGSIATTYIPTTTATVARNNETNYVDLWNNAMLNKQNWTLFWEGYLYDGSGTNISFALSDTTTASSDTNQIGWDSYIRPFYNISNTRTNSTNGATNSTVNKFAIQYNNGNVNYYINGVNIWSNQTVPVFDYRYLILNSGGSTYATDKISLWPRTLSINECIKITADPNLILHIDISNQYSYNGSATIVDLSGYSNNVTLINSPTYDSSNGGSIYFNGTNQYGFTSIKSPSIIHSSTAWVKVKFVKHGGGVVGSGNIDSSVTSHLQTAQPAVWQSNWAIKSGGVVVDQWAMITGVHTETVDYVYINGALQGTQSTTSDVRLGNNITIARRTDNISTCCNCNIGAIKVYDKALTAFEILNEFNRNRSRYGI